MRQFRKATIKDVAALARVSTSTVSYYVSGRQEVCSSETGQRIQAAVAELNYTPNSLSRGLRNSITQTLGLCMLPPSDPQVNNDSFFLERLGRGVMRQADAENYSLLLYPASVRERVDIETFLDGRVDGVLFHPQDDVRPGHVAAAGMPTVLMTSSLALPERCGAAWANETQTVDLALTHLWELGHRRIAHVAGPVGIQGLDNYPARDIAVQRLNNYTRWMTERNVFDPALVGYGGGWNAERVPTIMADWLRLPEPPTAVFCSNDIQALAVIETAHAADLHIPKDISVIGVDNSPLAADGRPGLTSVDVPLETLGGAAVSALLRLIQGAPLEDCRVPVPVTSLVVRGSTGAPRSQK